MNEDRLLKELAKVARDEKEKQRRLDERWDELAADDLSDEDRHELEALASESAEGAAAWEAFRPLDAGYRGRLADRLTASLVTAESTDRSAAESVAAEAPASDSKGPARAPAATDRSPDRASAGSEVASFDRFRRRRWVQWAAPAAVLAASLVLVFRPTGELAPLPAYDLVVAGRTAQDRSLSSQAPESIPVFHAGNRFEMLLTPDTETAEAVTVVTWLVDGTELHPLSLPEPQIATSGAVRVRGVVGESIDLPTGTSSLVVVVGRSEELPEPSEVLRALPSSGETVGDGWRAWRLEIRVE